MTNNTALHVVGKSASVWEAFISHFHLQGNWCGMALNVIDLHVNWVEMGTESVGGYIEKRLLLHYKVSQGEKSVSFTRN